MEARAVDATDPAAVETLFGSVGAIDHLVLTLGRGAVGVGPFETLDDRDLRAGFDGKFFAQLTTLKTAVPSLTGAASVTFVSAASAHSAIPGTVGLAAVNGALEAVVAPLAVELAPRRVNAVSPGVIDTAWWNAMPADDRATFFDMTDSSAPVGRIGTPDDVAATILFLAANGFVTGAVIDCTGGAYLPAGR